jgi:hypothetical protein
MRSQRLDGHWWRHSNPDQRIAGTLELRASDPPVLRLWGTLAGDSTIIASSDPHGTVHGETIDGMDVSLLDTYRSALHLRIEGVSTEEISGDVAVLGRLVESTDSMNVTRLQVGFANLADWIGAGAFTDDSPAPGTYRLDVVLPDLPAAELDGARIAVRGNWDTTGDRIRSRGVDLRYLVTIDLDRPATLYDAWRAWVEPMRDFLTFATDQPASITELRLATIEDMSAPTDECPIDVVGAIEPVRASARQQRPLNVPLPWLVVRDRLGSMLAAWVDLRRSNEDAMALYFAQRYRDAHPVPRFLGIAQALEVWHRRLKGDAQPSVDLQRRMERVLDAVEDRDRSWVEWLTRHAHEPSLRERLEYLFRSVDDLVYPHEDNAWREAALVAADTRNYYTHYDPAMRSKAASGRELHLLNAQLMVYLTALILRRLPLDDKEVRHAATATDSYRLLLLAQQAKVRSVGRGRSGPGAV